MHVCRKYTILPHKHSVYWAISSDAAGGLSHNPNILIVDELEAWAGRDVDLYNALTTSMGKRQQTLTILIATGSTERHPLLQQELDYARKVEADPKLDPSYLPILYYAKDDEAWDSEKTWKRVHPAVGDFFSLDFLRRECEAAKAVPAKQPVFEAYYLNRFTQSLRTWIPDDKWMACATEPLLPSEDMIYTAGLDLASVKDSNAVTLYGKRPDGNSDIIPFYWVAEKQVEQHTSADHDYREWCRQGLIRPTDGETANQQQIFADIQEICEMYAVRLIACDPYAQGNGLLRHWMRRASQSKYIPQTVQYLSEPLKTLERLALNANLCHGGHPVLRRQMSCAWVRPDGNNNYFLNKSKSTGQVDGVAALVNAIAAWQYEGLDDEAAGGSADDLLCFVGSAPKTTREVTGGFNRNLLSRLQW